MSQTSKFRSSIQRLLELFSVLKHLICLLFSEEFIIINNNLSYFLFSLKAHTLTRNVISIYSNQCLTYIHLIEI